MTNEIINEGLLVENPKNSCSLNWTISLIYETVKRLDMTLTIICYFDGRR